MIHLDNRRAVEHGIDSRHAPNVRVAAADDRADKPLLPLAQRPVDVLPELAGRDVVLQGVRLPRERDLPGLSAPLKSVFKLSLHLVGHGVGGSTVREYLRAVNEHEYKAVRYPAAELLLGKVHL